MKEDTCIFTISIAKHFSGLGKVPNSGQQYRFEVHGLRLPIVFGNHIFPELKIIDFLFEGDGRLY